MTADVHLLTGAYALDSVPADERAAFEQHLADCEECRQELAGLQATAGAIGAATSLPAPAGLRSRVMAQVAQTRQEPPLPRAAEPSFPEPVTTTPAPRDELADRRARRTTRVALAGVAASVVAAAALGIGVVQLRGDLDDTRARLDASAGELQRQQATSAVVAAVVAASDARTTTGPVTGGGSGTAVVSRSLGQGVFVPTGLARIPSSETYQLWLIGTGGPVSVGTFGSAQSGSPVLLAGLDAADKIGVTVEPAGGSAQPTTTPIMLFDV